MYQNFRFTIYDAYSIKQTPKKSSLMCELSVDTVIYKYIFVQLQMDE